MFVLILYLVYHLLFLLILGLLDKIVVMSQGKIIYNGSPRNELVKYLGEFCGFKLPKYSNLAEFILMRNLEYSRSPTNTNYFDTKWKEYKGISEDEISMDEAKNDSGDGMDWSEDDLEEPDDLFSVYNSIFICF